MGSFKERNKAKITVPSTIWKKFKRSSKRDQRSPGRQWGFDGPTKKRKDQDPGEHRKESRGKTVRKPTQVGGCGMH
jgi:ribosomal protein S4